MRTSSRRAFPYAKERIYTPPDSTLEDYSKLLTTLGCERAVLVQPSVYGDDNAAMLAALEAVGPGMRGGRGDAPRPVEKPEIEPLHRAGVRGLRFNVVDRRENKNQVPADMLREVGKRIAPFGWHIEMLVNLDEAGDFAPLLGSLGVPVVIGHLGYPKRRRGDLDADARVRRPAAAARRRAVLDQADRPLSDHHRDRHCPTPTSTTRRASWSRRRRSA